MDGRLKFHNRYIWPEKSDIQDFGIGASVVEHCLEQVGMSSGNLGPTMAPLSTDAGKVGVLGELSREGEAILSPPGCIASHGNLADRRDVLFSSHHCRP